MFYFYKNNNHFFKYLLFLYNNKSLFFLRNLIKKNPIYLFKFLFVILITIINKNLIIKRLLKECSFTNIEIKKQKKQIKKGLKTENIGNSIRKFLSVNLVLKRAIKFCYLIIRFKKKNLYLTLLNTEGNVLCKSNIGSFGFKKKVKFTGYAIKRTSKRFSKKILGSFIKTLYFRRKFSYKKIEKIKKLVFLNNILKLSQLKKRKTNIKNNIILKKVLFKYTNYREYVYKHFLFKNSFQLIMRLKNNIKFWGFNFIKYGLTSFFDWFVGIELRIPISHSKGLRLKKKRRV